MKNDVLIEKIFQKRSMEIYKNFDAKKKQFIAEMARRGSGFSGPLVTKYLELGLEEIRETFQARIEVEVEIIRKQELTASPFEKDLLIQKVKKLIEKKFRFLEEDFIKFYHRVGGTGDPMLSSSLRNIGEKKISFEIQAKNEIDIQFGLLDIDRQKETQRALPSNQKVQSAEYEYDVFISYQSDDEIEADTIRKTLESNGIRCFMAKKEVVGGDEFSDKIRDALKNSKELCLLFTPNSKRSEWVKTEWGAAWVLGRRIVPILLRTEINDLPDRLQPKYALDFHELDRYVNELKERLSE